MTSPAPHLNDLFNPSPRDLPQVHHDLSVLMEQYRTKSPPLFEQGAKLFKERPKARTEVTAAEALLTELRALAQPSPANLPFPATDVGNSEVIEATEPAACSASPSPLLTAPTDELDTTPPHAAEVDEVEATGQEEDMEPEAAEEADLDEHDSESSEAETEPEDEPDTSTSEAAPVSTQAGSVAQVVWPEGTLGEGLLSQLAHTLAAGDSLQLVIARTGDALLVTVQPGPLPGEATATALPLQLKGTPLGMDTQMVAKMLEYREGRTIAREEVNYAAQVKAAAEAARKAATTAAKNVSPAKKPSASSPSTSKTGTLTLEVAPKDALLVLTDEQGQTHPTVLNKPMSLPAGTYTIHADAEGYTSAEEKITVKGGALTKKGLVLTRSAAQPLF